MAGLSQDGWVRPCSFSYPLLLLVAWTCLILTADFVVVDTSLRQIRSSGFPSTTGKIVMSAVAQGAIRQGGVHFQFNFTVHGVDYTGHRYRYDDRNAAFEYDAATNAFPTWSMRRVFYNPANPEDSLLDPGLDGSDLLLLLFALPVSVVTFALWMVAVPQMRKKAGAETAGGVRILQRAGETRACLAELTPWAAGGFGLGAAAFVSAFPVVSIGGFLPSLRLMWMVWAWVFGAGFAAFFWSVLGHRAGKYDLRIDPAAQTVILPQTSGRTAPLTVPRREIVAVSVLRRVSQSPVGEHVTYIPALECAAPDAEPRPVKLVTWGWSEARARAFSHWLGDQLQVMDKGIQAETPASTLRV
jgi:hypothetical protein